MAKQQAVAAQRAVRAHDPVPPVQGRGEVGRLARNPTDAADPLRATAASSSEIARWSVEELRTFLQGAQGDRHYAAYVLLATTACGEVRPSGCAGRISTWTWVRPACATP